jgi:hypothetical protein
MMRRIEPAVRYPLAHSQSRSQQFRLGQQLHGADMRPTP